MRGGGERGCGYCVCISDSDSVLGARVETPIPDLQSNGRYNDGEHRDVDQVGAQEIIIMSVYYDREITFLLIGVRRYMPGRRWAAADGGGGRGNGLNCGL